MNDSPDQARIAPGFTRGESETFWRAQVANRRIRIGWRSEEGEPAALFREFRQFKFGIEHDSTDGTITLGPRRIWERCLRLQVGPNG